MSAAATRTQPAGVSELREIPFEAQRLKSLDALRGFDMFWIIGGGAIFHGLAKLLPAGLGGRITAQLDHVPWQGLHAWDVIWPLFMFVVGVAMRLSYERRRAAGTPSRALYAHAVRRALILFVLGMVAQGNLLAFSLSKLRPCYSVLHGIAAGYLIATIVMMTLKPKWQAAAIGAFLLVYWALVAWIPVPGVGAGVLTPDGNAATYIDRLVLGRFHYGANTWFLSYLGFASSVLLGVLAGELLLSRRAAREKLYILCAAGAGSLALGLIWSLGFPIIKLLWTSSYVLVCGGISYLLLAAFYLVIDVLEYRRWAFAFVVIGMNSIAVYMAAMLFDFRRIGNIFVGALLPRLGAAASLVEALAAFAVVWLILFWMYRTKSFLRI